jgi:hypothetical protein
VFSPLTPADVVTAIGRAARDAARSDEPASEFSSGQLMSAYSASRHLGVELARFDTELASFAGAVAADLRDAGGERLAQRANHVAQARDAHAIGDLVAVTLDELRGDPAPVAAQLRGRLRSALRELADREVELLAEVIEGPRA